MRFFNGILYGMEYYASIMPTYINGTEEFRLEVYTRDWRGQKQPDKDGLYKTECGAERALRKQYPDVLWREL